MAAVTALGPGGVGRSAVVAPRVLDDLHEADRARVERRGDRVGHARVRRRHDADVLQLADRGLGGGEAVAARLGAEHRPAVDLPCDFVLVAADLREARHDVRERVARRPPQERRVARGGDEQLALPVDHYERVAVGRGLGRTGDRRDHAAGDGRGRTTLATRGRGEEKEKGEKEREEGDRETDETVHGEPLLGEKALLTARVDG